jgi:hypothetical protein
MINIREQMEREEKVENSFIDFCEMYIREEALSCFSEDNCRTYISLVKDVYNDARKQHKILQEIKFKHGETKLLSF